MCAECALHRCPCGAEVILPDHRFIEVPAECPECGTPIPEDER